MNNKIVAKTRRYSNENKGSVFVREKNNLNPILSLLEVATGEMKNVVNREESSKKVVGENTKQKGVKKTNEKEI